MYSPAGSRMPLHRPVMVEQTLHWLDVRSQATYIDCTFGSGGHARAILEKADSRVIAIDCDPGARDRAEPLKKDFGKRFCFYEGNFADIGQLFESEPLADLRGILYDLGYSTDFLQTGGCGLSFQMEEEPLDMRYSPGGTAAADILNSYSEREIERVLRVYGEERYARRIARRVVAVRERAPLARVGDFVRVIREAVPSSYRHGRINCATRSFQALRIAANNELENLSHSLASLPDLVALGVRVVVISFHSLEDRIVKNQFRTWSLQKRGLILTKKPIIPTAEEVRDNPASRSAKLRAFEFRPLT